MQVDLDDDGVTVDVQLQNTGDSPATGQQVSADGLLDVTRVTTDSVGQGLYRHRAFLAAPSEVAAMVSPAGAAATCGDDGVCTLPDIPAGATVTVTVHLTVPENPYQNLDSVVSIGDAVVEVALDLTPTVSFSESLKAGQTAAGGDIVVSFLELDGDQSVASFGAPSLVIRQHADNSDLFFTGRDGCSTSDDQTTSDDPATVDLTCTGSVSGRGLSYPIDVSALPQASDNEPMTIMLGGQRIEDASLPVTPREPGDPIDLTGPFVAEQVGAPTTHCTDLDQQQLECHYHSPDPPSFDVRSGELLSAELSWIAGTADDADAATEATDVEAEEHAAEGTAELDTDENSSRPDTRYLALNGEAAGSLTNVGRALDGSIGSSVYTADVSSQVRDFLAERPGETGIGVNLFATSDHAGGDRQAGPHIPSNGPTGWTLTLIWSGDQTSRIEVTSPTEQAVRDDGIVTVAENSDTVASAATLALWSPFWPADETGADHADHERDHHDVRPGWINFLRSISEYTGVWCSLDGEGTGARDDERASDQSTCESPSGTTILSPTLEDRNGSVVIDFDGDFAIPVDVPVDVDLRRFCNHDDVPGLPVTACGLTAPEQVILGPVVVQRNLG